MCIFLCGYILWVLRKESREKNEKKRKMNKDDKESYDNDWYLWGEKLRLWPSEAQLQITKYVMYSTSNFEPMP